MMERIPNGIGGIQIAPGRDKTIQAKFDYRSANFAIESIDQMVLFHAQYPFTHIVGADFGESEINEWVTAHGGNWLAAGFLLDKIVERGGSLPPRRY